MNHPKAEPGQRPSDATGPLSASEARAARRERRRARRADAEQAELERTPLWTAWTEHRDYFLCLCRRWLRGNCHDAEDVMSEAALKLMELDHEAAAGVQNPRSWIARVLHNLCADLGRRSIRARAIEEACSTLSPPGCGPPPDVRLHDARVGIRVTAAVDGLPESLRSVLVLRLVEGRSYKQIGALLGITDTTARKRAQLGRDELKHQLSELRDAAPHHNDGA